MRYGNPPTLHVQSAQNFFNKRTKSRKSLNEPILFNSKSFNQRKIAEIEQPYLDRQNNNSRHRENIMMNRKSMPSLKNFEDQYSMKLNTLDVP